MILSRLNHLKMDLPLKRRCEIVPHKHNRVLFLCDLGSGAAERSQMKVDFCQLFGQMRRSESGEGQNI